MVMGLDQTQEREGMDRTIIAFPGVQDELITKVATCAAVRASLPHHISLRFHRPSDVLLQNKPVIVVIMSGGPVDLTNAKANPDVDAIMWVGYPGQSGGTGAPTICRFEAHLFVQRWRR